MMPSGIRVAAVASLMFVGLFAATAGRADDPFARSKDYNLQNVRTHLQFNTEDRGVAGETTQSLSILRDGTDELKFDSVDLKIESVTLNGASAKFDVQSRKLVVKLPKRAKRGEHEEVTIRYSGHPKKGLYFVLPDTNDPNQPIEIWSQGESEDTRYYVPIYDYPNDRTTSEMLLTVPASWVTVSNGRLAGVKAETNGMKTWDWKQAEPLSTYLISVVAGEFVEQKDQWRGMPVEYVVPRGDESKIEPTFSRTKGMLDAFSDVLDVRYPWAKYAQSSVHDFVAGGMENTSATTLTTSGLVNPQLASERIDGSDGLDSHELAHQWFGDLVTCKDWADIWLNEGFATYFEHYWTEKNLGKDDADYEFWGDMNEWFENPTLFKMPIVDYREEDAWLSEGNIYGKGGIVLRMLREKLGDEQFFGALHQYLATNRNQNVVTADLSKSIEQATSVNVDEFFHQWVYGAGAPDFEVTSKFENGALQLEVKQKQKIEGTVGLFHVPVDVEVATASGKHIFPIDVKKADETFTFTIDGTPQMVIFDQGQKVLKHLEFQRDPSMLTYQLKNAEAAVDRADAAKALGEMKSAIKENDQVISALGEAATHDAFDGVRIEAARALGSIGGTNAEKLIVSALANDKPWVRDVVVKQFVNFKDDPGVGSKLADLSAHDKAYRVRGAALETLGRTKAPLAYDVLVDAVKSDSPDDTLRRHALMGLGELGDKRAVGLLLEWSAQGKPLPIREAAIESLAGLDSTDKQITKTLVGYLDGPEASLSPRVIEALGKRGDPDAIPALEAVLTREKTDPFSPFISMQIDAIREKASGKQAEGSAANGGAEPNLGNGESAADVMGAIARLQRELDEMNARLAKIESQTAK
jgi:aminopeptidase N